MHNALDALLFLVTITVAYFLTSWYGWWGVAMGLAFASLAIAATLYAQAYLKDSNEVQ